MTKKQKTKPVGQVGITTEERRQLKQRFEKHWGQLRQRYPEIWGKRVDGIDHRIEDGQRLYVEVQFTDGTCLTLAFAFQVLTTRVELSDMSSGEEVILRTYYPAKTL